MVGNRPLHRPGLKQFFEPAAEIVAQANHFSTANDAVEHFMSIIVYIIENKILYLLYDAVADSNVVVYKIVDCIYNHECDNERCY